MHRTEISFLSDGRYNSIEKENRKHRPQTPNPTPRNIKPAPPPSSPIKKTTKRSHLKIGTEM